MPLLTGGYSFGKKEEEEKGFLPATGSAVLNVLELLERPSQALKVGIKESLDGDEDGFGHKVQGIASRPINCGTVTSV